MVIASLRVVFFGTPDFAVPTLDALLQSRHTVVGVVTQPDRPRDRGQKLRVTPVKGRASDARIPVMQPERMRDDAWLAALAGLGADLGVVAAYGRILTEAILSIPRLGLINVHASLLPRYRGAAPVQRAILDGERETGVTIMRVVRALDAGPMLASLPRLIGPEETSDEVERDLAHIGARLALSSIDALAAGPIEEVAQDDRLATYAPRLSRDEGRVNWSRPADRLHNLVRGLHPWPHAFTQYRGKRLILLRSTVKDASPTDVSSPGTILGADGLTLDVETGRGVLAISELQPEGRRPMTAREFLAGHPVRPGEVLTDPP